MAVVVLMSPSMALAEEDIHEQDLGYGVAPLERGNTDHHHIEKRQVLVTLFTTITGIITTIAPFVVITLGRNSTEKYVS